ncbi:sucrase/ferredoxin domain containing protein [Venturia nashicola]|uniref:Defect at low temperature protein 1 n=1 Tax=Venturia nashicola TaxID=86259 RepID=A0A4Z1NIL3_9PEZI|nr:sucrase/ferredoxin domain containing protein [Venturia nashicola]TLD21828.1 sucrase/ferredoxin domain containing protein [Venturia nashicola]
MKVRLRSVRIPYFQIWYSSAFLIVFFTTWVLTLVIPADIIYQSVRTRNTPRNIPNVFIIAGAYVLTIVISFFIWASRIYTNRVVLKEIPKAYIPVDKGEVPRKVHRMIIKQWERSALVAWDSMPRDIREELVKVEEIDLDRAPKVTKERTIIQPDKANAAWGYISHPGWSSPASNHLPNLEYWRVFIELPNLIEAKAVSLAPADPRYLHLTPSGAGSIPDARIVALLQRPSPCGIREYLERLRSYGLVNPPSLSDTFVSQYEHARFSTSPLSEIEFGALMATFSSLLTGMTGLDPALVGPEPGFSQPSTSSLTSSFDSTSSQIHHRQSIFSGSTTTRPGSRFTHVRSSSTGTVRTAMSRAFSRSIYHTPSNASLASEPETLSRTPSSVSEGYQLAHSRSRESMRSVIRLNPEAGRAGQLPYTIS